MPSRPCALGFKKQDDISFEDTFVPTAKMPSVRMFQQVSKSEGLLTDQLDFSSAYLNSDINTETYVTQPEGYKVLSENGTKLVCKLKKGLYGLKQSGRLWNNLLTTFLSNEGYQRSLADPCLYSKHFGKNKILILIWVDDLIILHPILN